MSRWRLLIWVQHLLGTGHLTRPLAIAKACATQGGETLIASGGPPTRHAVAGHADFVQLPPLMSPDTTFAGLVTPAGDAAEAGHWQERQQILRQLVQKFQPDIVLTEMFPFGRRKFKGEILPWLDFIRSECPCTRLLSSVRDILVTPRKSNRAEMMVDWAERYYDEILVHADPSIVRLEASLPQIERLADRLRYTGYIVDLPTDLRAPAEFDVVVSAGGGRVGRALVDAAIAASHEGYLADRRWLVACGSAASSADIERWHCQKAPGLSVVTFDPALAARIAQAEVSVSQAGYNTVAETLASGTPMVLVPFETETEDEQIKRARICQELGRAVLLREAELSVNKLGEAMEEAAALSRQASPLKLAGAQVSARILALHAGR